MNYLSKNVKYIFVIVGALCLATCKPSLIKNNKQQQKSDSASVKHKFIKPKSKVKTIAIGKNDLLKPFPPEMVAIEFKNNYPNFTQPMWSKSPTSVSSNSMQTNLYRVDFKNETQENSATYTEIGERIETKVKILPEQLPQNIYEAIKVKYPGSLIISAFTYSSKKSNATYFVILKTEFPVQKKELIINENGVIEE